MPIQILMPALSPTMSEGNLTKWLKREGDEVRAGEVIAEIETDKATMELEAADDGKLGRILVADGTEGVKVNRVIALLLEDGETESDLAEALKGIEAPEAKASEAEAPAAAAKASAKEAKAPVKPAAGKPAAAPAQPVAAQAAPAVSAPAAQTARQAARAVGRPRPALSVVPPAPALAPAAAPAGRVPASPLARRMARDAGVDLTLIAGTGPRGRIVKADVEAALAGGGVSAVPGGGGILAGAGATFAPAAPTVVPHTAMRKVIARRMAESMNTAPHFYVTVDCDIDELLKIRKELKQMGEDYTVSVNDFLIRAAALALLKVPEANTAWSDEGVIQYDAADVAVAVAFDGGLITPIVRAADKKGVAVISREMKDLAARARGNELAPEEYRGGTFTLSNLGMFGVREFTAIINSPQACILAVGAGEQRPVVIDGDLAIATMMSATLSCDHRVVDGVIGARFMAAFKTLIEHPVRLVL
ncbi:MAG: pyruvate dehydrogenase complex dihydrolipoamide acetyltransferase [Alphaproteobacteria bacterium]|nr:MAG: pyruvate dehydrogenase complex dihydrolipoamide acetyltransferase [Alphaproteobacteria bacterium]